MIILGIDPGFAIVGWGVIEAKGGRFRMIDNGAVLTKAGLDIEERFLIIYEEICEIIDKYKPDEMAIEELFFNTNQKTAVNVAQARGIILLAARQKGVKINEYTPLQVKQSVVGYGRAEKSQVIEMTKIILKLEKKPRLDDTADALAIAICHGNCAGNRMQSFYNLRK